MSKKFGAGVRTLLLLFFYVGVASGQEAAAQAGTRPAQQDPAAAAAAPEQDDAEREDPCPNSNTQFELNRCAARARDRADAELNKVYQQLMRETGGTERAKLRAAQLAWLKFRGAHCDYRSAGNRGGSIYPMVYSFCLAGVTNDRIKQLQEILREQSEQ